MIEFKELSYYDFEILETVSSRPQITVDELSRALAHQSVVSFRVDILAKPEFQKVVGAEMYVPH